ncbi:methylmalonyl-CoA epimerase [Sinobaca qinghaiensis]|uniref:Methylmalonyl-CoA epimerase n=1 Tax=Sinobaca qinghaiensis TaxID=342944 RepID=A0A419V3F3_9BACL|nr:methylmalonyl-CoA epimerase [Sinobaca qinghaiensis]RKD72936.1 methylmalonyl-CoA epimerase [Sinobaca qinghaiensis]
MLKQPPHKLDHIGIAVRSIEQSLPFYTEVLGLELLGTETVEAQHVKVAFLALGESKIELLEPTGSEGAVFTFLEKKGEGIHHVALGVTSVEERLKEIRNEGIRTLQEHASPGAGGALVAFLHPGDSGRVLVELCDKSNKED